jgi:hypothetical protein
MDLREELIRTTNNLNYEYEISEDQERTISRYATTIRRLCDIITSEYPESDDRYEFAMNCLTDVGEE